MKCMKCLSIVYEKPFHVSPAPEALRWVGSRSVGPVSHSMSILIRTMDGVEYTLILVHTGLGLQGRAIQKILRATCSVLQP